MAVLVGWDSAPDAAGQFAAVTKAIQGFEGAGANGRENGTPASVSFFFDSIFGTANADFRVALYEASTRDLVAYSAVLDASAVAYDTVVTESVTSVKTVVSGTAYMIAVEKENGGNNLIFRKDANTTTAESFTVEEGGATSGHTQDFTNPPPSPLPPDDSATGANQDPFYIWFSSAPGPTLDTIPATAFPGETITLGVTGAEAAQGTGGVTINGVAQTIDSWSDTSIDITVVQGDTPYGTGNTVTLTTDGGDTDTGTIELVADTASGFGFVEMSSPNTSDESSVAFGATPTVVTGDQFEWEDFNTLGNLVIDAEGFVSSVDAEGTFRGRFWDATDSTWGAVETFAAEVPGADNWPFSKGIKYAANQNWEWGNRHPMTNMRVRIYK